ncbi:hypothetical protein A2924_01595 [Candidatus Giovannonibacteria bacterium RIFCSPLOWO2_01_FULL_44_16]|uniref:PNPLA domain-containing protein n=1 Tax=Candidatus Giovannonibacteria bacterium RIFCSPLOWO2_01_FULL_44_16 TaxID=1798348 RepID=A0A1F5X4S1_9BACT|nr:MAG: hypothetical protein A2924_01595 [Candidatus Giovannonibacteria bacterium RIFCSPLOWO2_01_FULL_44_16]
MIFMPHKDYGRVGWFLGPGGYSESFPQAIQIREFWKAEILPDDIFASSAGVLNGWNPLQASRILKEHFSSPWAVYDLSPDIKKVIDKTLKAYKSIPAPLLKKHETWLESWRDWSNYRKNYKSSKEFFTDLFHILGYAKQILTSIPSLPITANPSPQELVPLLEMLLAELRILGLNKTESLLDPSPLFEKLRKLVDLQSILDRDISFNILARSRNEHHIFSCGTPLSADAMNNLKRKYKINEIKTKDDLVAASMASSAFSPYFPRRKINGRFYGDSGEQNPFPVKCLYDAGCDTVFAFVKNYEIYSNADELNIPESIEENRDVSMETIFKYQRERIFEYTRQNGKKDPYIIFPAPLHPDFGTLWVSLEAIEYAEKAEKEAIRKWLKDNLNIEAKD